jgi:cell division protein FtsL
MLDLAIGIEARNYGIRRNTDRHNLFDLLCIIMSISAAAGVLFFYISVRIQIINTGYEIQRLSSEEQLLVRTESNLVLEEETLKNPARIDTIARNELGMSPLHPGQIIPAGVRTEQPGAPVVAAINSPYRRANEAGKPSANN